MNILELPPSNVHLSYTTSDLWELPKASPRLPGIHDKRIVVDDYDFVAPPIFPIAAEQAAYVYFYGIRYDGAQRLGPGPLYLLDFWQNEQRLVPGVFDVEVFRCTDRLHVPDGWVRFDGGCSPSAPEDGVPRLELRVGVRKPGFASKAQIDARFSLRLCYRTMRSWTL